MRDDMFTFDEAAWNQSEYPGMRHWTDSIMLSIDTMLLDGRVYLRSSSASSSALAARAPTWMAPSSAT